MKKRDTKELKLNMTRGKVVDTKAEIAKRKAESPEFAAAYDAARNDHLVGQHLARLRKLAHLEQKDVAARMKTSRQAVGRLEHADYKGHGVSSLSRYVEALGGSFTVKGTKTGFRLEFSGPAPD